MIKNPIYSAAINYLKNNHFSIIPVKPDKKPYIKWEEFQKRLPTEAEILEWWSKWPDANIGIVTGIISGIAVIDLDDIEEAKKVLDELIPDSLLFPIVKTPSGGQHFYFSCVDGKLANNARIIPGADLRANGGYVVAPPSVNGNGKYWRWADDSLTPTKIPLPYLPVAYIEYVSKHVNTYVSSSSSTLINSLSLKRGGVVRGGEIEQCLKFSQGTRDNDLFHVANCLTKGNMPKENIAQVLNILAKNCNPPYPENELQEKLLSAEKRQEKSVTGITNELEALLSITEGAFSITECNIALQSVLGVTKHYNNAIRVIFHRWKKEGKIKPWGNKNGWYIKVDKSTEDINWWDADTADILIKYPFEIEDYVLTFPKNIITLAGEQNAGKTAFCLNFAKLNISNKLNMPIIYCSSEMGPAELKMRLSKFEDIQMPEWRKIKFIERASNFVDIIEPDGINIIDYMEITDNFYKVAEYTKEIFDKLQKGICLLAIQKDSKANYGRGGSFGLEKPRIYLNMGHGELKIVKAKSWKSPEINPNNMVLNFKIVNGSKLTPTYVDGKEGHWRDGKQA